MQYATNRTAITESQSDKVRAVVRTWSNQQVRKICNFIISLPTSHMRLQHVSLLLQEHGCCLRWQSREDEYIHSNINSHRHPTAYLSYNSFSTSVQLIKSSLFFSSRHHTNHFWTIYVIVHLTVSLHRQQLIRWDLICSCNALKVNFSCYLHHWL